MALYHYNKGKKHSIKNRYDKAIVNYKKSIKYNPESADTYFNLGQTYISRNCPTTGLDYLYKAGVLYLKKGDRLGCLNCIDSMKNVDANSYQIKNLIKKLYQE